MQRTRVTNRVVVLGFELFHHPSPITRVVYSRGVMYDVPRGNTQSYAVGSQNVAHNIVVMQQCPINSQCRLYDTAHTTTRAGYA